ncbi:3-hydroxyanthranilic acid dioxygenase [Gongronella butleri]|nr:3-hydroxyanthranilic acid dioxygenase [Gongronella butleri]
MLGPPINFTKWLAENGDKLQPPINNYLLFRGQDTIIMVVGGPNKRSDYHINETEEWFYQVKGTLLIKVVDDGEFKEIHVNEGDMFLLPPNVPHNPVRFADTIGLVVERERLEHHTDRLRWYCENEECRKIIFEESFHCTDLGSQLKPIVEKFATTEKLRTCDACGHVSNPN